MVGETAAIGVASCACVGGLPLPIIPISTTSPVATTSWFRARRVPPRSTVLALRCQSIQEGRPWREHAPGRWSSFAIGSIREGKSGADNPGRQALSRTGVERGQSVSAWWWSVVPWSAAAQETTLPPHATPMLRRPVPPQLARHRLGPPRSVPSLPAGSPRVEFRTVPPQPAVSHLTASWWVMSRPAARRLAEARSVRRSLREWFLRHACLAPRCSRARPVTRHTEPWRSR